MAWYRTGTISVTNGSTAVTGSGTAWIANAGVGEAIYGPDGRLYEIAAIVSNTSITLASNYLGATQTGQSYVIVPSQSYIRDLANQAAELINSYAETEAGIGQGIFPDGSLSAPALRFGSDLTTGLYRSASNEVTFVANGVAQFKFGTSGVTFLNGINATDLTLTGNTTLGNASADTVTVNAGTMTFVQGTANQVQYLDSNKKIVGSSNLVFDGTNLSISGSNALRTANIGTTVQAYDVDTTKNDVSNTFTTNQIISANTSSDALRITQTGSGNALLVEDSTNPDSTPFVVDSSGRAVFGATTFSQVNTYSNLEPLSVLTNIGVGIQIGDFASNQFAAGINFAKSRSGTVGTGVIVNNGDALGNVIFNGYDGAAYKQAASIVAAVDGTPGTNDMPGRLVFSTTADGASSPTERMRIDSAGNVGIAGAALAISRLSIGGTLPSAFGGLSQGFRLAATIPSATTSSHWSYISTPTTQATSFTLSQLRHFSAEPQAFGAGSTVTNQFGFLADGSLTGATNNYGFYSNIASGTGRYNFYAAGSADNYFAGGVGIGAANPSAYSASLVVNKSLTGATTAYNSLASGTVLTDVTSIAIGYLAQSNTIASAFTLNNYRNFVAGQGTFGAGSAVTNQFGFYTEALTGATNNYGFYSNIASGTGRYNFYAAGSADNYFGGTVIVSKASNQIVATNGTTYGAIDVSSGVITIKDFVDGSVYLNMHTTSNYFTIGTDSVERMRIDSSGNVIQTAPTTAPTLSTNGTMVFNLTSNTNLRVSVRGSDGVTRTANITLA